jgi:hypothetical protein
MLKVPAVAPDRVTWSATAGDEARGSAPRLGVFGAFYPRIAASVIPGSLSGDGRP